MLMFSVRLMLPIPLFSVASEKVSTVFVVPTVTLPTGLCAADPDAAMYGKASRDSPLPSLILPADAGNRSIASLAGRYGRPLRGSRFHRAQGSW